MVQAPLVIARWIAAAHGRSCAATATRRPLAVEIVILRELVARFRAEDDVLRAARTPGH